MSTIQVKKIGMGFRPASHRMACRNCAGVLLVPTDRQAPSWWCDKGGFYVTAMSICKQHKLRGHSQPPGGE